MRILLISVLLFVSINVGYAYFLIDSDSFNVWEIRLYIWYGVILGILTCLGVLRIYNAVVANTRYLLLLRRDMRAFSTTAKDFARDVQKYTRVTVSIKTAIVNLGNKINNKK